MKAFCMFDLPLHRKFMDEARATDFRNAFGKYWGRTASLPDIIC